MDNYIPSSCDECPHKPVTIPYIAYETACAKHDMTLRRMIIALVVAIGLLFASNIAWIAWLSQCDINSYDVSSEGGGDANFVGDDNSNIIIGDGGVIDGTDYGQNYN